MFNYPEKVHRDATVAQPLTRVVDLSRCEEHIINSLWHQKKHVQAVETKDGIKPINGSQRMKSYSTKVSDQCFLISW
jgi:hypothetical protein